MSRNPSSILVLVFALGVMFCSSAAHARAPQDYESIRAQAERLIAEGSYAQAHELYSQVQMLNLEPDEVRWVTFRLADTRWRAQAATQTHDTTIFDQARKQLEELLRQTEREEDRDRIWAEVSESLGDFWWTRANWQHWRQALIHYRNALDWWAGSSDLQLARARYLAIVWRMAESQHGYRYYQIPIDVLDNVLKIAANAQERSHANFLIASTLTYHGGDLVSRLRIPRAFEAALEIGKQGDWYDDALFTYGQWLMNNGPMRMLAPGQWTQEPDYVKALEMFQRLVREYSKGESAYYDQARTLIKQITEPQLNVAVSNFFIPGSEIQFNLNWRNVKQVDLALYKIDMARDVKIPAADVAADGWLNHVDIAAAEKLREWSKPTDDKKDYRPGQSVERLDEALPTGAYLLLAGAGRNASRALVLVSDASIILKSSGDRVVAFVSDAGNSAPLAGAIVRMWRFVYRRNNWQSTDATKTADAQGLCVFDGGDFAARPVPANHHVAYLAVAVKAESQAFAIMSWYRPDQTQEHWRIYAFTDRPAYRPGEQVQFKFIARTYAQLAVSTPAEAILHYEVVDPRGSKVLEADATLNAFGSAWGSLDLSHGGAMPLGEYRVQFRTRNGDKLSDPIGSATLFRLEEFKLPEFQVKVETPKEASDDASEGRKRTYLLGETVEATIQADYYFGGPVANATVEVIVHQNPYWHYWSPPREYPWVYEDHDPWRWGRHGGWGQGQIIKRETLRTDGEGRAVLKFETPLDSQQELEYRIEARVTDASRREIVGSDTVRVTRQRYYVHPRPRHNLHRPNDKVQIDFTAIDANGNPMQVEGDVKVTREQWIEIWIDPAGNEITGGALREAQARHRIFPPPPPVNQRPWRIKFQGYRSEDVLSAKVKLNDKGEGKLTFTAPAEGFYRIVWASNGNPTAPPATSTGAHIQAETMVWVADSTTHHLAYKHGGLDIVIDKDTFRAGQKAPVMISTPTNDRHVLFSVEGNELYSYQIVHVPGTVKLLMLDLDERHVPNIWLNGMMAHNFELYSDNEPVAVPAVEQYLNVEVVASGGRSQYQPGEEGAFTIKVHDVDGKPVHGAEVALSVADESVLYIQQDYAGDPRKFFFEGRQSQRVPTASTFAQMSYVRLMRDEKDRLIDERMAGARREIDNLQDANAQMEGFLLRDHGSFDMSGRAGQARFRGGAGAAGDVYLGVPVASAAPREGMKAGLEEMESTRERGRALLDERLGEPGEEPAVQVRTDFRSTLLWEPALLTDADGTAHITLKYADALTSWQAKARVAAQANQFGIASMTTRTKKPLIARLQAPRFFVVGDTVTVSGVINNNTQEHLTVTPTLEAEGLTIEAMMQDGKSMRTGMGTTGIAANSEARVDWQIKVESIGNGTANLRLVARAEKPATPPHYSDAMEKSFIVHDHGIEKYLASSGKVRGSEVTFALNIPAERRLDSTVLAVQVSPSMAVTMLDALPYLIDYPYGCTEQTMSRFLPAVIVAKTLQDLGLDPQAAMNKVFGGIEQPHLAKTQPKGKRGLDELNQITRQSLDRLYDFQHADGGWGWWKEGESDHFMTAYVLWGMCLAREADVSVRDDVIQRAANWLDAEIVNHEKVLDVQAWILHALATHHAISAKDQPTAPQARALENIWEGRDQLNAYTRALLALAAHQYGDKEKARVLVRNLENGVKRDDRPDTSVIVRAHAGPDEQAAKPRREEGPDGAASAVLGTAHWGEDGVRWRWSEGGVEATAFALRAILAINPKHRLVEPVTNWLIKNRRGAQWSNTRDTAITVLALNDYLRASGELAPQFEYELHVNGTRIAKQALSAADVLAAPSRFVIDRELIRDGRNEIRIKRTDGAGALYFAADATFFSLEEPVPAAGNEIFVRREYYKLVPRATLLKGYVYDRVLVVDGGFIASGERVEVVLTIEGKNNYEYLVFEDLKPAGLEAVAVRSGMSMTARQLKSGAVERMFDDGERQSTSGDRTDYTGQTRYVYQELRDRKVALFIDKLPEGVWELRYDLRAETPGRFHALPVLGHAMYVPELRCNGAEIRLSVTERSE